MARQKGCRICKKEAFIHLRYANLPLCKEHFVSRTESVVQEAINKFRMFSRKDKLLVAVSGGKDSLALWHIIAKLGYNADGIHIDLGLGEFSRLSSKISRDFAEKHGLYLHMLSINEELGASIHSLVKKRYEKPCSFCGAVKRYILNKASYELGYDVLITGHNLDDESARLLGNVLNWDEEYIYHQYPVLPKEGKMVKKVKPLVFISRKELASYCEAEGIEHIKIACPYATGARSLVLTDIMEQIESRYPATKLRFVKGFYKLRDRFMPPEKVILYECPDCGMPTSSERLCRFCRIKNGVKHDTAQTD
ncbi:MAG: hypothetical protein DRG39_02355 [Deltaproteobacteria bacterium]|nr:MAG: hypothetical protein DRG39_02355 [Deltaproteobacteria bacterium]